MKNTMAGNVPRCGAIFKPKSSKTKAFITKLFMKMTICNAEDLSKTK